MKRLRHIFAACATGFALSGCANLQSLTPQLPVTHSIETADPALLETAKERAKLAVVPFEEDSTDWQPVTTAEELMGKSRAGFDAALFRAGDRYAFVFYGVNGMEDVGEAVKVGFMGIPKKQLMEAHDFVLRASEIYGIEPSQSEFVGHSMGGYIAKAVGLHTGTTNIWAYNSPGFKRRDPARFDKLFGEDTEQHGAYIEPTIYNISSDEDVVGRWGYQPGEVFELDTGRRHHAIAAMVAALRNLNPFAAGEPPLAAEEELKHHKPGFMGRLFNRVSQSNFVQKRITRKFRSAEQPPATETRAPVPPPAPNIG